MNGLFKCTILLLFIFGLFYESDGVSRLGLRRRPWSFFDLKRYLLGLRYRRHRRRPRPSTSTTISTLPTDISTTTKGSTMFPLVDTFDPCMDYF